MKSNEPQGKLVISAIRYPLSASCSRRARDAACAPKGDALYARAEKSLGSGEIDAAIIDLKNLVKDEPGNAKARALLANALVQNGDISAAAIEVQKAKELGAPAGHAAGAATARCMVARSEFDAGDRGRAGPTVRRRRQGGACRSHGRALFALSGRPKPSRTSRPRWPPGPTVSRRCSACASATYALDGLPAAKAFMDKASPAIQKRSTLLDGRRRHQQRRRRPSAAEVAYQKAVDALAAGADAGQRLVALAHSPRRRSARARSRRRRPRPSNSARSRPNNPLVKQLKGQVAAAGGNLDEARTLLEEAVAAMPDNQQARLLLGLVNMRQGNLGQAEMHFASVVAKEPGNVEAQRLLAQARAQLQSPARVAGGPEARVDRCDHRPGAAHHGEPAQHGERRPQAGARLPCPGGQPAEGRPDVRDATRDCRRLHDGRRLRQRHQAARVGAGQCCDRQPARIPADGRHAAQRREGTRRRRGERSGGTQPEGSRGAQSRRRRAAGGRATGCSAGAARRGASDQAGPRADADQPWSHGHGAGQAGRSDKNFRKVLAVDPKNLVATLGVAVAAAARKDNVEAEKWLRKAATDHPDNVRHSWRWRSTTAASRTCRRPVP